MQQNSLKQQFNQPNRNSQSNFFLKFAASAIAQHTIRYKASYSNPASIQLAQKHQKAAKYGYKPPTKDNRQKQIQKQNICGCCNLSSNNIQIPLTQSIQPSENKDSNSPYRLTQDVALFFTFIKCMIILVIIHSIIYASYNILSSRYGGNYCSSLKNCQSVIWNLSSVSNKINNSDPKLIIVVDILNLVCIIVSIIYFGWNRRHFYNVSKCIDQHYVSQGDFTLLISNIPNIQYPTQGSDINTLQSKSSEKIKNFLQNIIAKGIEDNQLNIPNLQKVEYQKLAQQIISHSNHRGGSFNERKRRVITGISLCYNLSELQILQNSKSSLIWGFQSKFVLLDFCGFNVPDLCGFKNRQQGEVIVNNSLVDDEIRQPRSPRSQRSIQNTINLGNKKKPQDQPSNQKRFNKQTITFFEDVRRKVKFINQSQIILMKQLTENKKLLFHNTSFTGNAFISFQYEQFKQYLQRKFYQNPKNFIFNGNQLKLEDACEPTDVFWMNMRISESQRSKKILFSYIVLALLLIFSFAVMFLVEVFKRSYIKSSTGGIVNLAKSQGLNILTTLIILGVNSLFDFVTWFLTNLQGHITKTNFMFSHMLKNFFSKLINTIMMYFVIAIILTNDYQENRFMGPTGLVSQIYNFFVISGLINVGHSFINRDDLWMRLRRWYLYTRNRNKSDYVESKYQISLNRQFELPQFSMTNKYCDYLITLYTALFYAYLVPIVIPTVALIFFLQYWVDKFTLFKRSSLKNNFNFNLSIYVSKLFQSSILIFCLGNLIFSFLIQDFSGDGNTNGQQSKTSKVVNIISIVLSLLFTVCIWAAPAKVQQKLFGRYEVSDPISYSECVEHNKFRSTYWNQNPATFCLDEKLEASRLASKNVTSPKCLVMTNSLKKRNF